MSITEAVTAILSQRKQTAERIAALEAQLDDAHDTISVIRQAHIARIRACGSCPLCEARIGELSA